MKKPKKGTTADVICGFPQPLGFYHALTGGDALHFGYWPEGQADSISLAQAQEAHSQMIVGLLPAPPAQILDVGCGLGVLADFLTDAGYQVVAIAPSDPLISYAQSHHPGAEYISCGFFEDDAMLNPPKNYDVILFQESMQYLPDLDSVFDKAKKLLCTEGGRLIMCDEVSYDPKTREYSSVHEAKEIERTFAKHGFFVRSHKRIGKEVAPTCMNILTLFQTKRDKLLHIFGSDAKGEIDKCIKAWKRLQQDYHEKRMGYEVWVLQPSPIVVRSYCPGDENEILTAFRAVFNTPRSKKHWQWKFDQNPFGGPYLSTGWDNATLVSHYAAYPVPIWFGDQEKLTYQVGDTFTLPSYRGIGRGKSSLLARAARHFHRQFCENKVPFFYGFNTGKIQQFGRLFLHYYPIAAVYEWVLSGDPLSRLAQHPSLKPRMLDYEVERVDEVQDWADTVFDAARDDYGILVARTGKYLQWRYINHPDYDYHFFVVRRRGRPIGWWLARVEDNTLLLGDALFCKKAKEAPLVGLNACLRSFDQEGLAIQQVRGWFSETPDWWVKKMNELGFYQQRHPHTLDLCITPFIEDINPEEMGKDFYFTHGDSDLF